MRTTPRRQVAGAPAHDPVARMAADARRGLLSRPPWLPSQYFYDERGSRLFEDITRLPEYYLTRTEEGILREAAPGLMARLRPREIVELGAGLSTKLRLLIDAGRRDGSLASCVLLDVSRPALQESVVAIEAEYPGLRASGVVGDFQRDLGFLGPGGGRLMAFLGSTLGNLHPREVPPFLRSVADALEPGDAFLLGLDLVKDRSVLEAAYDDAAGVTAEFNRNILRALNAGLGGDFDPEAFAHVAFYDEEQAWIEMRLRALRPMRVRLRRAGLDLTYARGDEIRTEISCKYTRESLLARLPGTGLALESWVTDPRGLFALAVFRPAG